MSDMYSLPPIIPETMEFDLPNRMYRLPMIQKSNVPTCSSNATVDVQSLKDLERRQEAILNQLESLKLEVSKLKGESSTTYLNSKIGSVGGTAAKDLVVRASPQNPPHILPILCAQLQQGLTVYTATHLHSSVTTKLPNSLEDFLPSPNCASRSKADLCITLIWKDVGKDVELVTSPTATSFIRGDVNVLRYISKRFGLLQFRNANNEANQEEIMDLLYVEKYWGSGNLTKIVSIIESLLKQNPFLNSAQMSISDLFAYSFLVKEKGKWPQKVQDWLKRCGEEVRKVPLKVDPNLRQRKPSRTFKRLKKVSESKPGDEIEIIEVGDTLQNQWPEIQSVYLAKETMINLLKANPIALISEKLDGSNLSLSSKGVVASRRKVILVEPTPEQLDKTKFAGQSLSSIRPLLGNVKAMKQVLFKPWFPMLNFEVIVYGEWLQDGTASSKEDKFNYQKRSLQRGEFYGFGLGLHFENIHSDSDLKNVVQILKKHKFSAKIHDDFIIVLLNGELKKLLEKFGILVVPVLHTLPFTKVFGKFAQDLLEQKVEGYILTIPSLGQILKWKNHCEESDPRRVESFVDIAEMSKNHEAIEPLNKVLQESLLYNANGRKRYFDPNLVDALNSARSKFPRLDDLLQNIDNCHAKKKIIEGYKFTLVDEITKDFGQAFGCTKKSIEAFIKHEI